MDESNTEPVTGSVSCSAAGFSLLDFPGLSDFPGFCVSLLFVSPGV